MLQIIQYCSRRLDHESVAAWIAASDFVHKTFYCAASSRNW